MLGYMTPILCTFFSTLSINIRTVCIFQLYFRRNSQQNVESSKWRGRLHMQGSGGVYVEEHAVIV